MSMDSEQEELVMGFEYILILLRSAGNLIYLPFCFCFYFIGVASSGMQAENQLGMLSYCCVLAIP